MANLYRFSRSGRVITRRSLLQGAAGAAAGAAIIGAPSATFAAVRQGSGVSGKVTQWCYPLATGEDPQKINEDMWAGLAESFKAENPDVEVAVEVLPWADRNTKLTTALAAGAGPDVAYLNADFVPQHAGDGNLEPVDDVIADEADDFIENARTNLTFDGQLYSVPMLMTVNTLLYNTKVFEAAGLTEYPATWEEMLAAGPAIKESGNFLTSYAGSLESSANLTWFPFVWQSGGEIISEDGTSAAFNTPEGLEALNFVVELFNQGFTDLDEGVTNPPFDSSLTAQGKVGVILCGGGNTAKQLIGTWGEDVLKVGPVLKNTVQTTYGTTAGFSVFKGSENVEGAKAWVKYITSGDAMKTILVSGGYTAPRASFAGLYADDPIITEIETYAEFMHGDIKHRDARAIISAVAPYIQAAFLGDQSSEDALAAAESDVNRLLGR